jgi:hypothetical protein
MLFTFDKDKKTISTFRETTLKGHDILERRDLEKWIEERPELLGEELLVLTTEYDKFDKTSERLDLLALDKDGVLVIVELKRDDSGKTVELQAIKYAAYCSTMTLEQVIDLHLSYCLKKKTNLNREDIRKKISEFIENEEFKEINDKPRIFIVSKEFRPEVTASVLWLRSFGIDITCVKLTPYHLDASTVVFESGILIPLPEAKDFIIQVERKENAERELSSGQNEYIGFWNDIVKKLNHILPREYPPAKPRSYYMMATGVPNVHYEWGFHGRGRSSFGVELHFESDKKELNLQRVAQLERVFALLEQKTNENILVQKNFGKTWARIYIERNDGTISEELKSWAVENMKIFYDVLQPELEKMAK